MLGNLLDVIRDPLSFLQQVAYTYGEIAQFSIGPLQVYELSHPDLIHEVLVSKADKFQKEKADKEIFGRLLGQGLLMSDGALWKRQRRLMQPAFHAKRIQAYAQIMVDYTLGLLESWQDRETRDIGQEMMHVTQAIVAKTLFNAEVSSESAKVSEALTEAQSMVVRQIQLGVPLPEWLPLPMNTRLKKARAVLDEIVLRIIRERRVSGHDAGDLLSMLLLAQDEEDGTGMTDAQVRDEVMTLFLAGHETTATSLTWTLYLLSQHPTVEARLHEELERVLQGQPPTLDALPQLRYTDMVIKESMRLYPPAWLFGRQALEDVEIGGYRIPRDGDVFISPYVMHHHPRYFSDPEHFDPERFSPENESAIPKYAYFPFGGGSRVCIGNSFAMMEARLVLATIAQRYCLSLISGQQIAIEPLITIRPKYGMRMQLHLRKTEQKPIQLSSIEGT